MINMNSALPPDAEVESLLLIISDPEKYKKRIAALDSRLKDIAAREAKLLAGQRDLELQKKRLKAIMDDAA